MSNANGKSEYQPLTLPTSGEVVLIREVAPFVSIAFRRELQKQAPKPPVQQTELGPIPNPEHPAYLAAMQEWQEEQAFRFNSFLMAEGVIIEWTDEKRTKLARARERALLSGAILHADDTMAYVQAIAVMSNEDMAACIRAVTRQTPTQEDVQQTVATFQPSVEGQPTV